MRLLRSALLRSLPLSMRIRASAEQNGLDFRFEHELGSWGSSTDFFFDDGSPLRSAYIYRTHLSPVQISDQIKQASHLSEREAASICVFDASFEESATNAIAVVYWPAEKTALERWISGTGPASAVELLPAKEVPSVVQIAETAEKEAEIIAPSIDIAALREKEIPALEPVSETQMPATADAIKPLVSWNSFKYGVVGNFKGSTYSKSYLLQRSDMLCFALMSGEKSRVQSMHDDFIASLKKLDDWSAGHRKYLEDHPDACDTLTVAVQKDGHCRFYCRGVQPVYWSGRLKKLMRFPNTETPLNSKLQANDALLMIHGGWSSREVAQLREIFLYWESGSHGRLTSLLDEEVRGRGILISVPSGFAP